MNMAAASQAAIVLLSGGLDSSVALADVASRMRIARALTFDYGQRAAKQEIRAAKALAEHYGVAHQVIALPWLSDLLPAALQQQQENGAPAETLSHENLFDVKRVWVPNRNGLFLNIAACLAEAFNATTVIFGANAEEGADFPDNTPAFREALNQALKYSTLSGVRVEAPLERMDKKGIIQHGLKLGVPFQLLWSCYEGQERQCGQCPSCLRVKAARDQMREATGQAVALAFNQD
jgi:7-cyano-7-deazaguanine synthase